MSPAAFKKREYDGFALQRAVVGPIATNVFFLINTKTNEVLLADPGDEAPLIIRYIKDNGYTLRGILLTHGHWDHTLAVQTLREEFACPVLAHEGEAGLLAVMRNTGSGLGGDGASGMLVWRRIQPAADAFAAVAILLELSALSGAALSAIADQTVAEQP